MSRKADSGSSRGFDDGIGVVLLVAALLLLTAQLSFDHNDIAYLTTQVNHPRHNWIGPSGAYLGWWVFLFFGVAGYLLPWLLAVFGAAFLLGFLPYLRERLRWSLLWAGGLLISLTGLLELAGRGGLLGNFYQRIGDCFGQGGGLLGYLTYGDYARYNCGFSLLGPIGATIVYAALCLVSLLFLTDFRLGEWIRSRITGEEGKVVAA